MLAQSIKAYGGRTRMSLGWDHHRQQIEKVIKDRDILATRWSALQEKKAQCHNSSPQSSDDLLVSLRRGVGGGGGEGLLFMIAYYRIARAASSWYPFQASGVSKE